MVKNHAHHTFEPQCLLGYRVLKILNCNTLLLVTPNGKERKTNVNDVKPCSTIEIVENAWDTFLGTLRTKCQNSNYNLRPQP